jgi:antitoxin HicB
VKPNTLVSLGYALLHPTDTIWQQQFNQRRKQKMNDLAAKYTVIIQWSDEDSYFVVSLPEWGEFCHTHGDTYEEALTNAQEVLEMLVEGAMVSDRP